MNHVGPPRIALKHCIVRMRHRHARRVVEIVESHAGHLRARARFRRFRRVPQPRHRAHDSERKRSKDVHPSHPLPTMAPSVPPKVTNEESVSVANAGWRGASREKKPACLCSAEPRGVRRVVAPFTEQVSKFCTCPAIGGGLGTNQVLSCSEINLKNGCCAVSLCQHIKPVAYPFE